MQADMSSAPWKTKWRRVPRFETSKLVDEGEESKEEKVAWQACGSKGMPKELESSAP